MLEDQHNIIRDALPFPNHSRATPAFSADCQRDGRQMNEIIYAVLDNKAGSDKKYDRNDKTLLPALWAWKVDVKTVKFVKLDVSGMLCPVSAINDIDRVP